MSIEVKIEDSWKRALEEEWGKPYFYELTKFVKNEYKSSEVYPPGSKIFDAFNLTPLDKVKVVILGQDPYHGPGQANGLCFSVNHDVEMPPSLVNIFREIRSDTGEIPYHDGDLSRWARQGVLLLNSTLTVSRGRAGSHQGMGWEEFTDSVIKTLCDTRENLVFILWGSYAIKKGSIIDRSRHLVLTSPHPSPLSAHRGFFGNHHFTRANSYLKEHGKTPVDWR